MSRIEFCEEFTADSTSTRARQGLHASHAVLYVHVTTIGKEQCLVDEGNIAFNGQVFLVFIGRFQHYSFGRSHAGQHPWLAVSVAISADAYIDFSFIGAGAKGLCNAQNGIGWALFDIFP